MSESTIDLSNLILDGEREPNAAALNAARELGTRRYRRALQELKRGIILDMDDTLNVNNDLFMRSRAVLVQIYQRLAGGGDIAQMALRQQEISNNLVPAYGFTPKRWFVASEECGEEFAGRPLTDEEKKEISEAAEIALGIGELHSGVSETLALLHEYDVPVVLLTKGEQPKQQEKIVGHKLDQLLRGRCEIVERKNAAVILEVAERYGLQSPVMIGDSESSDVIPALQAGFSAIHIDRGNLAWKLEQTGDSVAPKAGSFPEAVKLLLDHELDGDPL